MVDLELKATNLELWRRLGNEVGRSMSDAKMIRNVSFELEPRFKRYAKEAFNSQGSSTGDRWKPLSEPYRTIKARSYPGKTILRRKDDLFKSYTQYPVARGFRDGTGFTFKFGSRDFKAKWHQKGTSRMPARKVLNYTAQQLRGIGASIGRTIVHGMFSRGFFDTIDRSTILPGFTYRGFDRIEVP